MSLDVRSLSILEKLLCNERVILHKQIDKLLCKNEETLMEYIKDGISNTQQRSIGTNKT